MPKAAVTTRALLLEVGAGLALALLTLSFYGLMQPEAAASIFSRPSIWAGLGLGAINLTACVRGLRQERREVQLALELERARCALGPTYVQRDHRQ